MAQRIADGKRIYNEPWSHLARDVFFWCLFDGADSLGMFAEKPAAIAEALSDEKFHVSPAQVTKAIDELCAGDKPALLRYDHAGKVFLCFRKWQDHQKIRFDVAPTCPFPPESLQQLLSEKTQQLLQSNYRVTTELPRSKSEVTTADSRSTVTVTVTGTGNNDNGPSVAPKKPAQRKPPKYSPEENAWKQARLDHWDACLKHYYNGQPVKIREGGQAARFFVTLAHEGHYESGLVDKAINSYFREKDASRKWQRDRAAKTGEEAKAVAVSFSEFQGEFDDQMSKVLAKQAAGEGRHDSATA